MSFQVPDGCFCVCNVKFNRFIAAAVRAAAMRNFYVDSAIGIYFPTGDGVRAQRAHIGYQADNLTFLTVVRL
eukprot:911022-Amorphochlora_amoeboformis.AAC.1